MTIISDNYELQACDAAMKKYKTKKNKVPLEITDAKSAGFFSFSQFNTNYKIGLFKLLYSSYTIVNISINIFLNDTQN